MGLGGFAFSNERRTVRSVPVRAFVCSVPVRAFFVAAALGRRAYGKKRLTTSLRTEETRNASLGETCPRGWVSPRPRIGVAATLRQCHSSRFGIPREHGNASLGETRLREASLQTLQSPFVRSTSLVVGRRMGGFDESISVGGIHRRVPSGGGGSATCRSRRGIPGTLPASGRNVTLSSSRTLDPPGNDGAGALCYSRRHAAS